MRVRRAGNVSRMGEKKNFYRVLIGKYEGKRQLGKPMHRWEDMDRIHLA
jgi:hypothetical protein